MNINQFYLFIILLLTPIAHAKKLYKYQDENGIWQFTDVLPQTQRPVEVRQLRPAVNNKQVWLQQTRSERQLHYFARNTFSGSVELEVKLLRQSNIRSLPVLPKRFTIPPGASGTLFSISNISPYKSSSFRLQYSYTLGKPLADYNSAELYLPPIAPNRRFKISQAFHGKFSHSDAQNQYAVDIVMPEGTPIYAARAGMVMEVKNDFFDSGTEQSLKNKANSIRIEHEDGSMAVYAHLALEQAQVYPGRYVEAGELIAYSGNTGFSTGPHLHFAIQVNQGMKLVSVPFKFIDSAKKAILPQAGLWLVGVNKNVL